MARKAEFKPKFAQHDPAKTVKATVTVDAEKSPNGKDLTAEVTLYSGNFQDLTKLFDGKESRAMSFVWKAFNSRFVKAPAVKQLRDEAEGPEKHIKKSAEAISKIPGTEYYNNIEAAEAFLRKQMNMPEVPKVAKA